MGMIGSLFRVWPLPLLIAALVLCNAAFAATPYNRASLMGTVVLWAWVVFGFTSAPRLQRGTVRFALLATAAAAVFSIYVAVSKITPMDWPLIGAAAAGLVSTLAIWEVGSSDFVATLQGFKKGVREGRSGAHGTARWMTAEEKAETFSKLGIDPGQQLIVGEDYDPRIEPGKGGGASLHHFDIGGRGHVITVAPSGSGKTRGFVIPNIHNWSRGLVVLDPKGDLSEDYAHVRRRMGHNTAVLDPNSHRRSDSINVMEWLDPSRPEVTGDAKIVASWLAGDDPKSETNPGFRGNAKNLIWVAILEVLFNDTIPPAQRHLGTVRKFLTSRLLRDILLRISEEPPKFSFGTAQELASGLLAFIDAKETWSGVMFEVESMTSWLSQGELRDLVSGIPRSGKSIPLTDLVKSDTDFFVSLPIRTLETTPEIARLIFGSLISTVLQHANQYPRSDKRILFLLDEMPRFGYMKILEIARDAGRPFIILWGFVQDLGQLKKIYGDSAVQSWVANSEVRNFMSISDPETAKYVSDWIGIATYEQRNASRQGGISGQSGQFGSGQSYSESVSVQAYGRPLQTPSETMQFNRLNEGGTDEQYLFVRGKPPLRCGLALWDRRKTEGHLPVLDDPVK